MKNFTLLLIMIITLVFTSCSLQQRVATNITTDWNIARFENRIADGRNIIMENAGSITFTRDGTGIQNLTTNLGNAGSFAPGTSFRWENTTNTVTIRYSEFEPRKAWIIVENRRSRQLWYSTDSEGNVQVLELRRR